MTDDATAKVRQRPAGSFLTAIALTFPLLLAMRERSLAARPVRSGGTASYEPSGIGAHR